MSAFLTRVKGAILGPDAPFLAVVVLAAVLSHRDWFFSLDPIAVGDWSYLWPQWMQAFVGPPIAWTSEYGLGSYNLNAGLHWVQSAMGAASLVGVGFNVSERLFFFYPAALLPGLSMYWFAKPTFGRLPALLAGLVYELNTAGLFFGGAHLTHAVAYALAPLAFYFERATIRRESFRAATAFGLTFAIIVAYEPRFAYIIGWGLVGYLALLMLPQKPTITRKRLHLVSVMVVIPIAVHAYWILAALLYPSQVFGLIPNQLFVPFISLPYSFTLYNPFWSGGLLATFTVQPLPWFAFLLPLFAIAGLTTKRIKGEVLYFAVLALVGVFLAKQDNPPISDVYPWLFAYFPGFSVFRESSKFFILTALGYAILFGHFAAGLLARIPTISSWRRFPAVTPRGKTTVAVLTVAVLTTAALAPAQAAFANTLGYAFSTTTVPQVHSDLARLIDDGSFSRVLWFMGYPTFGFRSNDHPAVNATSFFGQYGGTIPRDARLQSLLDCLSIKYVVETDNSTSSDDQSLGFVRSWYDDITTNLSLQPVPGFPSTNVWLNPAALPRIYGLSLDSGQASNMSAVLDASKSPLPYQMVGTNTYRVSLPAGAPPMIVLSEGYDGNWIAEAEGEQVPSIPVLGMLNGFPVEGKNGTTVTITYRAQILFSAGAVPSILVIALSFAFIVQPVALRGLTQRIRHKIRGRP